MDVNNKSKILLIGASTQSAIYVAKQYKKYGLNVSIIDWHKIPIDKSRYIDEYYTIGSPITDLSDFVTNLISLINKEKFDCVLPIHDPAVQVCQKYYSEISTYTRIIGLNKEEIQLYATDKWKLFEQAKNTGFKIPKSYLVTNLDEAYSAITELSFPCVIKPRSSSVILNNKVLELSVRFANNKEEYIDTVREYINVVNVIVQEYLEGYGIGYNIISNQGKILNQYIHCRINENHGVSTYRETLAIDTFSLKSLISNLVSQIQWNGVAMIEFRICKGVPYLMEMNGRFWGSIELGIRSGLNYPVQLYEMQVLNKNIQTDIKYKLIKVRNLHEEILHFTSILFKGKIVIFLKWFFELIFKTKNSYIEDNLFDDPNFVFHIYLRDIKRIIKKRFNKFRTIDRNTFQLPKSKNEIIAFVCAGNICRSPFAEKYASLKLPEYNFISFGTIPLENRLPPMNSVSAAEHFHVNMNDSLSRTFDSEIKNKVSYYVVMEKSNYNGLLYCGVNKTKIFFLADRDIADPYKKDLAFFDSTYRQIANCIDQLTVIKN